MPDLGLGEGWIAAAGATLGAIALKVAERLLVRKKEQFEATLHTQASDQQRIAQLWARIDTLQGEKDRLVNELRDERHKHDQLWIKYDELRLILRGRRPYEGPEETPGEREHP